MTKFVRNSRLRRVVSTMCSVALLASLVVMPAYATVPGNVTSFTLNANLTAAEGVNEDGIRGTLTLETTGTPALQASQESTATYQSAAAQAATMASLGVTNTAGDFGLRVAIFNGQNAGTSFPTTDIPVPGISLTTTITGVVEAINAAISGIDPELRGTAFLTPSGRIRVLKGKAAQDAEIWVHSGPALVPGDVAAFAEVTDPVGLSLAEAVFGGNNPWGRGSGPADSYRVGTANLGYSAVATWSPLSPVALNIPVPGGAFQFGSFDNGVIDYDNFVSAPDTMTGLYTAVMSDDGNGSYALAWTAGRATPVVSGVSQLVYGTGVADPSYETDCSGPDAPAVYPSVVPTVGAVATWTVSIDDPDGTRGYWNWRENSYNGISVLFPKEFTLVNGPNHPDFLPALVAAVGSTPTVETSITSEGTLVTISNFVDDLNNDPNDGIDFQVALKAPNTAGAVGVGAKIWTHAVGTPWTANPTVTQLIDPAYPDSNGDDIADTDWYPVFCRCGTEPMVVAPDVIKTVTLAADVNRAEGYTSLVASAKDQFGNDVSAYATYGNPVITGLSDGAQWANYSTGAWVWQYAKTPGVNTASVVVDDSRTTTVNENLTATVSNNTSGIGEPAKVVVLPTAATWADGSSPSVQIQLQDANGNPTSWLDKHSVSTDWFEINAHSQNNEFPFGLSMRNRYIWRGWSKSSGSSSSGGALFGPDTTDLNAWPTTFTFGMTAQGPDTWTFTAKHRSGSVLPAAFATIDITGEDPAIAGVPVGFKITADKAAPADYASGDMFYNDKSDGYTDDAFGYAAAGGEDKVVLSARVVDAYGNTVTNGTANIPVTFEIPKFDRVNAIMPTGHVYNTTTNAQGVATVEVKSFEPTLNRRSAPSPIGTSSWFTPVRATTSVFFGGADWANPCGDTEAFEGYGFTYFHGARVTAALAETPECEEKDIVLADGVDTTGYEVEVLDSAFNTPIANWDLKFTTSMGSFANGSQAVTVTTDANGKAAAPVKSATAGTAYLRVFDRWRNAFTTGVDFTDYVAKQTVANATGRAGDRATIESLVYFENIKTGQRVQWDAEEIGLKNFNSCVYGPSLPDPCDDVCAVTHTNDAATVEDECGSYEVDTDNNGKMDAVRYAIPAYDDDNEPPLESAGMRYMLPHGSVSMDAWFNNVFYDSMEFVAAPARPNTEVNFVKEASLMAEGTQLDAGLNLVGSGFTPAHVSDKVDIYLGDITTHGRTQDNWVGYAYVGADGSLMPTAVFNGVGQIAPGEYDITVDGLVFKKGLVIKNLFNQAEIKFRGLTARSGDQLYINGAKDNVVQVDAYGALNTEVWMGGVKLANSASTGNFIIPKGRFSPGKYTVTAKVMWPTMSVNSPMYGGYTTVVKRDVYVQGPLKFSTPALSASGRTLKVSGKVSGAAEWNGSKAFKVKVSYQRLVNGRWSTVATRYVNASATTGKFANSYRVGSAGTYRAVVSHKDNAHPASSKGTGSRSVR